MHQLWCWIAANAEAITATAAAGGALFTALYLIATILIFNEARKSADAAAEAARAATDSTNLTAQLNRPYMGLDTAHLEFVCPAPGGAYHYRLDWTFRNFGTVPASHMHVLAVCSISCGDKTSLVQSETEPGDAEVFPGPDRLTRRTSLQLGAQQFDDFNPRRGTILAVATVRYSTPTGATYKHITQIRFDNLGRIEFIGSNTESL